ncbi:MULTISPECIES: PTS 2-O-a-mannosyl-D-glycerate transporter subunit IIABC [Priestia]|uniref:PTS 2-O-a-mannosyl-D-glycerate transporter subunit IIABC n=1 Tax=Priestia megaterium TaxID=1404 RepID=A0AAX6BF96_PRIMG|nr:MULTISPECIES: PTS 2-O-a-mannosyl-D-glycerate transporter subunit IIABC [Priestia]AWD65849.1 PTS 2-O-a-mannosyl-D-glycerate transporter subunit IIABC [Priestia megaterium]MBY0210253.1 PTS 2-O-a-mannosyl-D-glycerate transporter subunit IIABC [Priestia aryabhattai]MED3821174.1 PTS 2-O-a-mannosyl-D-glycerate transporter subunit IIABC [Priestia aryabhattai]QFY71828.1 PTS 2-O-a-mannosyl-D-glycerate transporter subunit IIABC [Priestia megaterium]QSF33065.1 PTS 2-O-a-mannosyl-D-glycerate transporte
MLLQNLTSPALIDTKQPFESKDEIIRYLIKQLSKAGKLHSEDEFYKAVIAREELSPTGFEGGLAIPHGKSTAVKEAAFAVATLRKPIHTWESIDPANQVELIILLAIPENESGSTHLTLLSELVTRLSNEDYKKSLLQATTNEDLFQRLDAEQTTEAIAAVPKLNKTVLAVTACPAGIAHTYMAAEALVKAGKELGIDVFVEKQGANGIEDRHTHSLLQKADAVIFATDVAVKNEERYRHLPKVKTSVASPLRQAKKLLNDALQKSESATKKEYVSTASDEEDKQSIKKEIKDSILTGISYIIPIIVAGGMTLAAAVLISQAFNLQEVYNAEGSWLWMLRQLGGTLLGTLMVPILAAYMAYSIADKPALGPGFAAGVAANLIGSGFLGGMLGGILAGYFLKLLKNKIKPKGTFAGFISFWLYPVVGTLVVGSIMLFVIGKPLAFLNEGLISWLQGMSGTNAIILGALIGAMVSFDLGGPINKAAYTFCIGAMASGNFVPYATFASVKMVSAFSITGATIIGKKHFSKQEQEVGKQTWLLGLAGITEGAIPFMMNDPLRVIPSLIAGSAVTGAIVSYFQIGLNVPGAGIFSLALLKGQPVLLGVGIWLGAAVVGAAISTILLLVTRKTKLKKQKKISPEANLASESNSKAI